MTEEKRFSTPLARKVKQGSISQSELTVQTTLLEVMRIPWEKIVLAYLGKVDEISAVGSAPARKSSGIRVGKVIGGLLAGPLGTAAYNLVKRDKDISTTPKSQYFFLLDLYTSLDFHPYRFDSIGTNFKTFLNEEAGYSGELNLFSFVRKISLWIAAALDSGVSGFLEKGENLIPTFPSRDEFSWHSEETYRERAHPGSF